MMPTGFVKVVQRASLAVYMPKSTNQVGRRQRVYYGGQGGQGGKQPEQTSYLMGGVTVVGSAVLAYRFLNEKRTAKCENLNSVPDRGMSAGKTIQEYKTKCQDLNSVSAGRVAAGKTIQECKTNKSMYATKMKASAEQNAIDYENRIRQYSTPDQTFNYFATYLVSQKNSFGGTSQWVMMSPMDLFNALTPEGAQSQPVTGSGNYIYVNSDELQMKKLLGDLKKSPVSDSLLNKIGQNGLLTYNDFCFLLTVMSTPRRYISTAFELFDINGDGFLDAKEFSFTKAKLSYNPGGFGDYDILLSKQIHIKENIEAKDSGLMNVLFGKERAKKMTLGDFSEFIYKLQDEMIELEFREYDKDSTGRITEVDLGNFLLKNAKIPTKLEKKMMKRVKNTWPTETKNRGVSLPSFKNLYQALVGGEDLQRAMFFLDKGDGVDLEEFQKIFKWVSKQELSDHVAKVMFVLFDNDMDGKICTEDIQNILFNWRKARGFEKLAVNATIGHKKKDV